ncbi:hypothetical protein LJC42_00155 [Eubacteriales bacterium OttesenSCG-928-K08]|nr:hypothetical protein [Eubacteriales bacterium OttesenSCG-928-K08]
MKAYKGFDKNMQCRGFQFEVGKEYVEDQAKLCQRGFHACEAPLGVFRYYAPNQSVYHEVELSDVSNERKEDSKVVGKNIKIGAALDIAGLCKAQFEFVKAHTTYEHTDPKQATAGEYGAATAGEYGAATAGEYGAATAGEYGAATAGEYGDATAGEYGAATAGEYGAATAGEYGAATAGNSGAATAGEYGAATAGEYGAATAGEYGAATAGYRGAATAGYRGAATAGNSGAATAGEYGAATAGNSGAATAGYRGAATSKGRATVGENGIASVRGNNVSVRGGMGAILVICVENENDYDIKEWRAAVVDGETIKADTWYTLLDGQFVEVKN